MKKLSIIRLAVFLFIYHVIILSTVAQDTDIEDDQGDIQDAEIVIEKDRQIELDKEVKLYELMKWKPTRQKYKKPETDSFYVFEYDLADKPSVEVPAKAELRQPEEDYLQYVKGGLGNYFSPIIDLTLVTPTDPNQTIGLNFKHLSFNSGEVDDENSASSLNEISIHGTKVWDRVKTNALVSFKSDLNYYYGYPEGTLVNRQSFDKRNNFLKVQLAVEDNNLNDDWQYELNARYQGFFDNYDNEENKLSVSSLVSYTEDIFLDLNFDLSSYNEGAVSPRSHFKATSYYDFHWSDINIKAGFSFNAQNDTLADLTRLKLFPYLKADYAIFDTYEVYAELDAGYDFKTLYSFSENIPYLNQASNPYSSEVIVDFDLGLRGSITDDLYAALNIGYSGIRNLPYFINNSTDQSLIDLVYDPEVNNVLSLELTSRYVLQEEHSFQLTFGYSNYDQYLFHIPNTELSLKGEHLFFDDLTFQWQYALLAGISAYSTTENESIDLDPISRLDLNVHYQIQERLGAFISSDNTFNQNYSRYLNYPQRGIQIKGGITYRF